jgi:hypothetical protein
MAGSCARRESRGAPASAGRNRPKHAAALAPSVRQWGRVGTPRASIARDYKAGLGWLVREERNDARQSTRSRPSPRENIEGARVQNTGCRRPRGIADLICTSGRPLMVMKWSASKGASGRRLSSAKSWRRRLSAMVSFHALELPLSRIVY